LSKIVVEREHNVRLFLIDGHILCSYRTTKGILGNIRVEIRDVGGVFKRDCNSIVFNKSDFEVVKYSVIKKFVAFHIGDRLGNKVYNEIVRDFGLPRKLKEKVVFT